MNNEWLESFEAWLPELIGAIPDAFDDLTAGRDDLVAVSMFTDADGRTLQPAALTHAHLVELAVDYPRFADAMAWEPDEWDVLPGADQAGLLGVVMSKVGALADRVDEGDWLSFTMLVFNWMVEAMRVVADGGWFEARFPGANVVFWVTDHRIHPETAVEWVVLLNPPGRADVYIQTLRSTSTGA